MVARIQTTYPFAPDAAMEGMGLRGGVKVDAVGYATSSIPYGHAVVTTGTTYDQGMTPQVKEVDASTNVFFGVTLIDNTPGLVRTPLTTLDANNTIDSANSPLKIRRKGQIWVRVAVAVAIGDNASVVIASKLFSNATGATVLAIPGGKFVSAAAANGLALLEIN